MVEILFGLMTLEPDGVIVLQFPPGLSFLNLNTPILLWYFSIFTSSVFYLIVPSFSDPGVGSTSVNQ